MVLKILINLKRILCLSFFILIIINKSIAQEYYEFNEQGKNEESEEESKTDIFWKKRMDKDGSFKTATQSLLNYLASPVCEASGNWQLLGPTSLNVQAMGIIISLWIDPNNHDFILAGSNTAGLWKPKRKIN